MQAYLAGMTCRADKDGSTAPLHLTGIGADVGAVADDAALAFYCEAYLLFRHTADIAAVICHLTHHDDEVRPVCHKLLPTLVGIEAQLGGTAAYGGASRLPCRR